MIKMIIFDIDGIITDDTVIIDDTGREQKRMNFKDVDAIFELHRRGFKLAAITGEGNAMVDYFHKRFPWDYFYSNSKHKRNTIQQLAAESGIALEDMCFIGEGKYDVEAIEYVGLGVCPPDSIMEAKQAADIILQNRGGHGCVWELVDILERYNNTDNPHSYFYQRLEEHSNIFKSMASDIRLIDNVMSIGNRIIEAFEKGNKLLLCGNGGSAADAQHIATEFISRFYKERKAMNAEALTVNTSTLTAISNDYSYEKIFVRQVEAKGNDGDVLIGISTSGKSKSVLEALRYARSQGIYAIMLMGNFYNRELEDAADLVIKVPSQITPRIQEAHIFLGHLLAEYVEYCMYKSFKAVSKNKE